MTNIIPFALFESNVEHYTLYLGTNINDWKNIWKDKKLKNIPTHMTKDPSYAVGHGSVIVEIDNIPLEAFIEYFDGNWEKDDAGYISMKNDTNDKKKNIVNSNDIFLLNLYPYKKVINTKLLGIADKNYKK